MISKMRKYKYKTLIAFFKFKNIIYTLIENTCNLQTENY